MNTFGTAGRCPDPRAAQGNQERPRAAQSNPARPRAGHSSSSYVQPPTRQVELRSVSRATRFAVANKASMDLDANCETTEGASRDYAVQPPTRQVAKRTANRSKNRSDFEIIPYQEKQAQNRRGFGLRSGRRWCGPQTMKFSSKNLKNLVRKQQFWRKVSNKKRSTIIIIKKQ